MADDDDSQMSKEQLLISEYKEQLEELNAQLEEKDAQLEEKNVEVGELKKTGGGGAVQPTSSSPAASAEMDSAGLAEQHKERIADLERQLQDKVQAYEQQQENFAVEREKLQSQLHEMQSTTSNETAGGRDSSLKAENVKLEVEKEKLESELAEKMVESEQKEDEIAKLKEEKRSKEELIEEWTIQLDTEEKRADQATEQLQVARQLLRQSGIKLPEDGDAGDEDPVAAMHRAKEEKWKSEEEELRAKLRELESEVEVRKEETLKLEEQSEAEKIAFEESNSAERAELSQKVKHLESLLFGLEEDQKGQQLSSRVRQYMRSLQQQQQQLVAVHRGLLMKYATLEHRNRDFTTKLNLMDDKLKSYESTNRILKMDLWSQQQQVDMKLNRMHQQTAQVALKAGVEPPKHPDLQNAFKKAQNDLAAAAEIDDIFDDEGDDRADEDDAEQDDDLMPSTMIPLPSVGEREEDTIHGQDGDQHSGGNSGWFSTSSAGGSSSGYFSRLFTRADADLQDV